MKAEYRKDCLQRDSVEREGNRWCAEGRAHADGYRHQPQGHFGGRHCEWHRYVRSEPECAQRCSAV